MPVFKLELSEEERVLMVFALGAAQYLAGDRGMGFTGLAQKLMSLSPGRENGGAGLNAATQGANVVPASPSPAAAVVPQPAAAAPLREHWAEKANRAAAESMEFAPMKVERKDLANSPRLVVSWPGPAGTGRRFLQASCFDEKLFGAIANRIHQKTLFYIQHSADGKYTNIVGVRA